MARNKPSRNKSSRKKAAGLGRGAIERIAAAALEHPGLGIRRLFSVLEREGVKVTEGIVRGVLKKQKLHTRELRLNLLEERHLNEGLILSDSQQRTLHDFNPCLRERRLECHEPGELLVQDAVDLGKLKNIDRAFLYVAIDPCCCLAFATLVGSLDPSTAVEVLNDQALMFYRKEGIAVQAVEAGNGLFSVTEGDSEYADFLKRHGITLTSPTAGNTINGFIERFARLVRKDFLARAGGPMAFQDLEAIQFAFGEWVEQCYNQTPLPGYPIMGRTPLEAFRAMGQPETAQKKAEAKPAPEPEPAPVSLPTAVKTAPPPPPAHILKHHDRLSGREVWGFRAINAALVCLVIYFGWLTVSKFVYYQQPGDGLGPEAPVHPAPTPGSAEARDRPPPLGEYNAVWDRNLFGVPASSQVADKRERIVAEKIAVAGKEIGLKLIGTVVTNDPKLNYAIIDVAATRDQGIFREKERVGGAVIKAIVRNNVIIETKDGRRKRLTLDDEGPNKPRAALEASDFPPEASTIARQSQEIHENPDVFKVPRQELAASLDKIRGVLGNMSDSPQMSTGNPNVFFVRNLGPQNILARLGLRPGDLIRGVDDEEFESPQEREFFLRRLVEEGDISILVQRRGRLQRLNILIE